MDVILVSELSELPKGCRLVVYGAGGRGRTLVRALEKLRRDIEIVGYADTYKSGSIGRYKIYDLESLGELVSSDTDIKIIIASTHSSPIYWSLLKFKLQSVFLIAPFTVCQNKDYNLSDEGVKSFSSQLERISSMFKRDQDKLFLRHLPALFYDQLGGNDAYLGIMDHYLGLSEQYFDFINKDVIGVAIEGGMFDGGTTLRFLHHFPRAMIHGFEPFQASVQLSPFYPYLKHCKRIVLNYKGLSDETGPCFLNINPSDFGVTSIFEGDHSEIRTQSEAITIDEYAAKNKINKIDFIKLDIESFEIKALNGARMTIKRDRPQLAICLYHCLSHYYEIPLLIKEMCDSYNFYVGFYGTGTFFETVLYGIPSEIDNN